MLLLIYSRTSNETTWQFKPLLAAIVHEIPPSHPIAKYSHPRLITVSPLSPSGPTSVMNYLCRERKKPLNGLFARHTEVEAADVAWGLQKGRWWCKWVIQVVVGPGDCPNSRRRGRMFVRVRKMKKRNPEIRWLPREGGNINIRGWGTDYSDQGFRPWVHLKGH